MEHKQRLTKSTSRASASTNSGAPSQFHKQRLTEWSTSRASACTNRMEPPIPQAEQPWRYLQKDGLVIAMEIFFIITRNYRIIAHELFKQPGENTGPTLVLDGLANRAFHKGAAHWSCTNRVELPIGI